jgi:hypothetical protein
MSLFLSKDCLFFFGEHINLLKGAGLVIHLRDESSLAEIIAVLLQALLLDKGINIS